MQQSRREEMRNVMNTAWTIARQTSEAFGTCLKRAWANSKLRSALKEGVVRFTFRKVDGSVREAVGTLYGLTYKARSDRRSSNPTLQVYYDVEKDSFRCFKKANLIAVAM